MVDNERSKVFFGVLNVPNGCSNPDRFFTFLNWDSLGDSFSKYAYIVHDKDVKEAPSDGGLSLIVRSVPQWELLKTIHAHILLVSPNRRRTTSVIDEVASILDLPRNCVSIQKCINITASLQYMIHWNQKEKFQYSFSDIYCNDESFLISNFRADEASFTEYFLSLLEDSKGNYPALISKIGLQLGRKYKDIIYNYFKYRGWFK